MRNVIVLAAVATLVAASARAQCPPAMPCESCEHLRIANHNTLPSGYYDISPNGLAVINAWCIMQPTKAWTVIDPAHEPGWAQFFSSWASRGPAYGPASSPSYQTWARWFLLSPGATFATSEDGTSISSEGSVYRMTGNYYGCTWFNRNCDFNGTCRQCSDPIGQFQSGTCPYFAGSPGASYPHDCGFDWWNEGPSIGSAGHHVVAYWHFVEEPVPVVPGTWGGVKSRFSGT